MASRYKTIKQRTRLLVDEALSAVRSGFRDDESAVRSPEMTALEQRLLMSATPAAAVAQVVDSAASVDADAEPMQADQASAATATQTQTDDVAQNDQQSTDLQQTRTELVVVDPSADDHEQLVADLQAQTDRHFEILVLDPHTDGIAQITDRLQGLQDVSAVHLVSHGEEGEILLGTSVLSQRTIDRYAAELVTWQGALTADADLLIYGCDLAGSEDGIALTESLNALLGTDVAASTDDTGNAALGGDWVFEQIIGHVQTDVAFTAQIQADWNGILSTAPAAAATLVATDELLVNQTTGSAQHTDSDVRGSEQAVAISANGEYVVVWTSAQNSGADGDGTGVLMRRFNASGVPLSGEIQVNTQTTGDQLSASVALDENGRGVVVWRDDHDVMARVFDPYNGFVGTEFRVNTTTSGNRRSPTVDMQANGNFIVAWSGEGNNGNDEIYFRRFTIDGAATDAAEVRANANDRSGEEDPAVAINDSGQFVLAWEVSGRIYLRHFNQDGSAAHSDLRVENDLSFTWAPDVDINNAGQSVLVYREAGAFGIGAGVWGRAFSLDGSTRGDHFAVSSGSSDNTQPSVALADNGSFVVVYHGDEDGDGAGSSVKLRRYNASSSPLAAATVVNQTAAGDQHYASVAALDADNYVVAWSGRGEQTGQEDTSGVFVRQYGTLTPNLAPVANAGADVQIAVGEDLVLAGSGTDPETDPLTYTWDLNYDGSTFAADVTGQNPTVAWTALQAAGVGPGIFDVALQVDDGNGGVDVDVLQLTVTTSTLTVDTTSDVLDGDVSSIAALYADKGADGRISLREAIQAANNTTNAATPDRIEFEIPDALASGAHTLSITSALPEITDTVIIDGTTDSDFVASPVIVLDGSGAGTASEGLTLAAGSDGSTIRGLAITRFARSGLLLQDSGNHTIAGNYIGTDQSGTTNRGNTRHGISLDSSDANTIGGTTAADRNVILASGLDGIHIDRSDNNVVIGNFVGFLADESGALGQDDDGIYFAGNSSGNRIGGAAAGEGNVIVGSGNNGLEFGSTSNNNTVQGNWIGVAPAGTALGNATAGIRLHTSASDNVIGGTTAGQGNTIAGNGAFGVSTSGSASRNLIIGNSISGNGGLGIDVGHDGAVTLETSTPDLILVENVGPNLHVRGTVSGTPGEVYTVAIYSSATADPTGHGEAERFLAAFDVTIPATGTPTVQFNEVINGAALPLGHHVTATASDSAGTTSEFAANFQVGTNVPPDAVIAPLSPIAEGDSLTIDASGSSDLGGGPLTYEWDLNYDGATFSADVTDEVRTLSWAELSAFGINDDGTWQIALRVHDGTDYSTIVTSTVTVTNTAPTFSVSGASEVVAGEAYTLTLNHSDPGEDSVVSWTVNWGDGEVSTYTGAQTTASHTYTNASFTNNISVSVRDEDGSWSNSQIVATGNAGNRLYFNDGQTERFVNVAGNPVGIIVGPDGFLYVSNFSSHDIDRYDPTTGNFVDRFVIETAGGLLQPSRMAFGPDGTLYVSSLGSDEVLRYGTDGRSLGTFITGINNPDGLVFDHAGDLYVSQQSTGNIYKYDGRTGTQIGGGPFASFGQATFSSLQIGPGGNLFASSTADNVIREFDSAGAVVGDFGGGPLTDLTSAAGFAWGPAGRLYVADNQGDRIGVYAADGTFLEHIAAGIDGPVNIAVTSQLRVAVTSAPQTTADAYTLAEGDSLNVSVASDWFNTNWQHRREIAFNNATGGQLNQSRVLVRLHSSAADAINIDYTQTRDAGEDLRFVDPDGTVLDHQIEAWDESGYSYVWVEVPQIDASSTTDSVFLYYGNQAAIDGDRSAATWGSDYTGVYHLNSTSLDATSARHNGAISGVVVGEGIVADAGTFNGTNSEIRVPASASTANIFNGGGTVSAWINPTGFGENSFGRIVDKAATTFAAGATGNGWGLQISSSAGQGFLMFDAGFSGDEGTWRTALGTISLNAWQHVAVVYDHSSPANTPQFFIDGELVTTITINTPSGTPLGDDGIDLVIGNHAAASSRTFEGRIDEVRISRREVSADQLSADYASVAGTFIAAAPGGVQSFDNGVLANDFDTDGDRLTVSLVSGPAHASAFTLNPDGSFNYTHDGSETTTDSFQYQVSDGSTISGPVTVSLAVTPQNDPPSVSAIGNQTLVEDTTSAAIGLTIGDPDNAAGTLIVTATSSDQSLIADAGIVISGTGSSRAITLTPVANATGGPAVITVTVSDGTASTTTSFHVSVTATNDPPAVDPVADQTTNEDTVFAPISLTVSDPDNAAGTLIVTAESSNHSVVRNSEIVVTGSGASRTISLTPRPDQSGSSVITVSVFDGITTTQTTFNANVLPVNDAPNEPVIADVIMGEDTSRAVTFTVSDIDNSSADLLVTATSSDLSLIAASGLAVTGSGDNRTLTISPRANQSGTAVITVSVSDGAQTTQTTFQVDVTAQDDAPLISAITDAVTNEDTAFAPIAFSITDPDTPVADLVVTASSGDPALIRTADILISGTGGSRQLLLTPLSEQSGTATITVSVSDGTTTTTTTFDAAVTAVNDAPVLSAISDVVIAEDTDSAPIALTISDVDNAAADLTVTATSSDPSIIRDADLFVSGTGAGRTLVLRGAPNATGGPVTVTVTVSDGTRSSQQSFQVTVTPTNDAPRIAPIANVSAAEGDVDIPVTLNIDDADNAITDLTISVVSGNQSVLSDSAIQVQGTGKTRTIRLRPDENAFGTTTLTVSVTDGTTTTVETFDVEIAPVNDAPVIDTVADISSTEDDTVRGVKIRVRDIDDINENLVVTAVSADQSIIASSDISVIHTGGGNRVLSFTPRENMWGGPVELTIFVSDGEKTAKTSFDVVISPVNDVPQFLSGAAITVRIPESLTYQSATGALMGGAFDVEGDAMTVRLITGPIHGDLTLQEDGTFSYVADEGFAGLDRFEFVVTDGMGDSVIKRVSLRVPEIVVIPSAILAVPVTEEVPEEVEPESEPEESMTEEDSAGDDGNGSEILGESTATTPAVDESGGPTDGEEDEDDMRTTHLGEQQEADAPIGPQLGRTAADTFEQIVSDSAGADQAEMERVFGSRLSSLQLSESLDSFRAVSDAELSSLFTTTPYETFFEIKGMVEQLDHFRDELDTQIDLRSIAANVLPATGATVIVGSVVTAIRTGVLALGFLTQLPVWTMFDPLMVMDGVGSEDGDSLEDIVDRNEKKTASDSSASAQV
ncbi:MAG: DUF2341 domain-containing protein [Planctomycetaceae bacterium]|nr:DUF2341 domain-containing protein [Planctomycetaceae bacterium]